PSYGKELHMAVASGKINLKTVSYVSGDHVFVPADVAGDTSYPTGGSSFTPAMLGLTEIHHVDFTNEATGASLAAYDYAAQKMKTFTAFGTETTNATNQSAKTW